MHKTPVIAIHGGAGTILRSAMNPALEQRYRDALREILEAGAALLAAGAPALDAVTEAVRLLEECPLFNAGKGAVYTEAGGHELDASVMDGATLQAGAVAGVTRVRNPVLAARAVMHHSGHVLMAGPAAQDFVARHGVELVEPTWFDTPERHAQLLRAQQADGGAMLDHDGATAAAKAGVEAAPIDPDRKFGTVGAVAMDANGNLAAATSTGGMTNKRVGRVGDTPVIGAGCYANDARGGVVHGLGRDVHPGRGRLRCVGADGVRRPVAAAGGPPRGRRQAAAHRWPGRADRGGPRGEVSPALQHRRHVPRLRPRRAPGGVRHLRRRASKRLDANRQSAKPRAEVRDLSVRFETRERTVDAVKHLSFHVDAGETLAIVGESGSGKSVSSLAMMRLMEHGGGRIASGA
jgi:beta-aspartyl-peptidase (threonine type)